MKSFFFYDLETSGLSPREDRIMQFAGQRTDADLNPLGEPVNVLVKLAEDTLPSPGAILVTKITPQSTQKDGLTEAEFCDYAMNELFTEGTCAIGYNSVRFDDEFMRHTFWRNFVDPYAWQWQDDRSRWDMLDVVRLTRALRPSGINWPTMMKEITDKETGETKEVEIATNRLELITKLNGIEHTHAHDALSDVFALIDVTRLIKKHQPKLFQYLFDMRDKRKVAELVNLDKKRPFVYASGRYSGKHNKTTVVFPLTAGRHGNIAVFDLRYNLDELLAQKEPKSETFFPVTKELCLNKCPAVAPLGVLEVKDDGASGWERINLSKEQVEKNLKSLLSHPEFAERVRTAYEADNDFPKPIDPESALYDGFLTEQDSILCNAVRNADADHLADFHPDFSDERLPELLLHYKAKNYPTSLSDEEAKEWEEYRISRLNRQMPAFAEQMSSLQASLAEGVKTTSSGQAIDPYILEELSLWYQNLQPTDY